MALAVYDEDGVHEENGRQVAHHKGDLKFDEEGMPYYEILGTKESYGREVLKYTDTLTVDGSSLNKIDFFDSDGLTKSVASTIARTVFQLFPYFIPGVGKTLGTIGIFTGLASVMPTFGKAVNGIIGGVTGGTNDTVQRNLTQVENWFAKFGNSLSDEGQKGFWNLENISSILSSSARQLYSQRSLAKLSESLAKSGSS